MAMKTRDQPRGLPNWTRPRMTNDDFESARQSILQELRALQQGARSLSERLEAKRESVREKYREQLDLMTGDQAVARRYLHDDDASHRLLALEVLGDHRTPDSEYYEQCERLVAEDPKLVVRAKALKRLGAALRRHIERKVVDARGQRSQ